MAILASTIVSQSGPENLPNDIPDEQEEELPENTPELDQEDSKTNEEIDLGIGEEEPRYPAKNNCFVAICF